MDVPRMTEFGVEGAGNTSRGGRDGASEDSGAGGLEGISLPKGDQASCTAPARGA